MLDFNFHITTPRLTLSHLNPDNQLHCTFVRDMNNRPEMIQVHKDLRTPAFDLADSRKRIEQSVAMLERRGYGRWLISRPPEEQPHDEAATPFSERINTHDFLGIVSMNLERHPGAPMTPDLGFALLSKYYGQGYATEAAQGLMKYYRETKGHTAFSGYTSPSNESSKKLFRRLGFEERGVWEVTGVLGENVWFKVLVFTIGHTGELDGMRKVQE
jgi:RimJ/RimL family protein N-acetyltransferase